MPSSLSRLDFAVKARYRLRVAVETAWTRLGTLQGFAERSSSIRQGEQTMRQLNPDELNDLSPQDRPKYDRAGWRRTTRELKAARHKKRRNKIARRSRRHNRRS